MVLDHQRLLGGDPRNLQPALQLYAAAASQLAQQNRVPPWATFLQFGVPNMFGNSFLPQHNLGGPSLGNPQFNSNFNGSTCSTNSSTSSQKTHNGDDSNDDRGNYDFYLMQFIRRR